MKALQDLSADIKQQFTDSRERVASDIKETEEAIQAQRQVVADVYQQYILDVKTLSDYQTEQSQLKELQESLAIITSKLDNLETAQQQKIFQEVLTPMKEVKMDADKEKRKIFAEKRDALLKAKVDYLKLVNEMASDLIKLESATSVNLAVTERDAGLKTQVYSAGAVEPMLRSLVFNDTYSGGNPVITVSEAEVKNVFTVKKA